MTEAAKRPIADLTSQELAAWCETNGEKPYRAVQIRRWLYGKRINSFDEMHDVPAALRERLVAEFDFFASKIVQHQVATDRTEKLLLELHDGEHVECVVMREPKRRTVCISTQVGCAMGCVFCASGLLGVKRNLSTGEILEQILRIDRLMDAEERLSNVVVMGIGEPLANLSALLPAVETLNEKGGMGIGARRITISTVGLPDKIRQLADLKKGYTLAVSLHAPNDELRTKLVPVNNKTGIAEILKASDEYFEKTGRRVSFEYVLLSGVNDQPDHARQLGRLLKHRTAHVNLIPMNNVTELDFVEPSAPDAQQFANILEQAGVVATIRKRKGADIDAACGQLRLKQTDVVQLDSPENSA